METKNDITIKRIDEISENVIFLIKNSSSFYDSNNSFTLTRVGTPMPDWPEFEPMNNTLASEKIMNTEVITELNNAIGDQSELSWYGFKEFKNTYLTLVGNKTFHEILEGNAIPCRYYSPLIYQQNNDGSWREHTNYPLSICDYSGYNPPAPVEHSSGVMEMPELPPTRTIQESFQQQLDHLLSDLTLNLSTRHLNQMFWEPLKKKDFSMLHDFVPNDVALFTRAINERPKEIGTISLSELKSALMTMDDSRLEDRSGIYQHGLISDPLYTLDLDINFTHAGSTYKDIRLEFTKQQGQWRIIQVVLM